MLGAALGWAIVASLTRILGEKENTSTLLFYTLVGFVVILLVPQYWIWTAVKLDDYLLDYRRCVLWRYRAVFGHQGIHDCVTVSDCALRVHGADLVRRARLPGVE